MTEPYTAVGLVFLVTCFPSPPSISENLIWSTLLQMFLWKPLSPLICFWVLSSFLLNLIFPVISAHLFSLNWFNFVFQVILLSFIRILNPICSWSLTGRLPFTFKSSTKASLNLDLGGRKKPVFWFLVLHSYSLLASYSVYFSLQLVT